MLMEDFHLEKIESANQQNIVAKKILTDLEKAVVSIFLETVNSGIKFRSFALYGSTPNCLSIGTSDVDVSLNMDISPPAIRETARKEIFQAMQMAFSTDGTMTTPQPSFTVTEFVSASRVPVLKIKHTATDTEVTI
jgi:DNA polymerase sigma